MRRIAVLGALAAAAVALALAGCPGGSTSTDQDTKTGGKGLPVFTLAWSEYPSWSAFQVASDVGLIDGAKGKTKDLENAWGVDVELRQLDYKAGITDFAGKKVDAVCVTNVDALDPALARRSVAVLPTSTSDGADALVVVGVTDLDDLLNYEVHGPKNSVSDYVFSRVLEKNLKDPAKYRWKDTDPKAASQEIVNGTSKAAMLRNPNLLQTLRSQPTARNRQWDSSKIPEEVIDLVVVGEDVLKRDKGKEFVCCLAEAFYKFNRQLDNQAKHDQLRQALGSRLGKLDPTGVDDCLEKSKFYKTSDDALELFDGAKKDKLKATMDTVVKNLTDRKVLPKAPKVGYGPADQDAQLVFDPTYLKQVKDKLAKEK